ncbi:CD3072 family TudS-related putative desulfidase [Cetobacterium sp.]|uniref:CD3072 family TudS-related putative desulfidase n=1 Tax=Cetobacterium sp. TaxID=2071632 RepID=UPI003F3096CE
MNRAKKIVIVSHCILNQNCVVKPYAKNGEYFLEFVKSLLTQNIGIIQLPCPEMTLLGLKRWGHVKDQFEYPGFLEASKNMLYPILNMVQDYLKNGYEIKGVYGIAGSPSCGVNKTCRANWEGEASCYENLDDILNRVKLVKEKGIFMEIFEKLLEERNIVLKFYDIDDWSEQID